MWKFSVLCWLNISMTLTGSNCSLPLQQYLWWFFLLLKAVQWRVNTVQQDSLDGWSLLAQWVSFSWSKNVGLKVLSPNLFWVQEICCLGNVLVQKMLRSRKFVGRGNFLVPDIYWSGIFFGLGYLLVWEICCPGNLLVREIFQTGKLFRLGKFKAEI
jgi:hypothetical protein